MKRLLTTIRFILLCGSLGGCAPRTSGAADAEASMEVGSPVDVGWPEVGPADAVVDLANGDAAPDWGLDAPEGALDLPAVSVTPLGLRLSSNGPTLPLADAFGVALTAAPGEVVTIDLDNSDPTLTSVSPLQLSFDDLNFGIVQSVTVTAVSGAVLDHAEVATIVTTLSATGAYAVVDPPDVDVAVLEGDSATISVDPTTIETSEAGTTATFGVVLDVPPTSAVMVPIACVDQTEGLCAPQSLTFSPTNLIQTVTVTGLSDALPDGDILYPVTVGPTTSTDLVYAGVSGSDVQVTNRDQ